LRTEAILAGLGNGLTGEQVVARANEVLQQAGVEPSTHEPPTANYRGTAVFISFKQPGQLRIASNKIRRINTSFDGRSTWLDARRTQTENRPNRAIHSAAEALGDLIASIAGDGTSCPLAATDLVKNMRKLTIENKEHGPVVCWWNVRLEELTFSEPIKRLFADFGRSDDLDQIAAWCSLE
jgi:hypothetical protein